MVPPRSTGHLSGNWSPPLCTRPRPLFRPHPRNVPQTGRDTPLAPIHVSSLPPHSPQPSSPPRPLDIAPITGRDTRSAGRMPRIVVAAPLPTAAVSPPPPPRVRPRRGATLHLLNRCPASSLPPPSAPPACPPPPLQSAPQTRRDTRIAGPAPCSDTAAPPPSPTVAVSAPPPSSARTRPRRGASPGHPASEPQQAQPQPRTALSHG